MDFLLTEVALEMLGFQFYDEHGEPHGMSIEGFNVPRLNGALSLEESLHITFADPQTAEIKTDTTKTYKAVDLAATVVGNSISTECAISSTKSPEAQGGQLELGSQIADDVNVGSYLEASPTTMPTTTSTEVWTYSLVCPNEPHTKSSQPQQNEPNLENQNTYRDGVDVESSLEASSATMPTTMSAEAWTSLLWPNESHTKSPQQQQNEPRLGNRVSQNAFHDSAKVAGYLIGSPSPTSTTVKTPMLAEVQQSLLWSNEFISNIDEELKAKLDVEMLYAMLKTQQEKPFYCRALSKRVASGELNVSRAVDIYRKIIFEKLQGEIRDLVYLREKAENLCLNAYPEKYQTYLFDSKALKNKEFHQTAEENK